MPKLKSRLLDKIVNLEQKYKSKPLVSKYKPKLCEIEKPSTSWDIFYKQADAFNQCKQITDRVFAVESYTKDTTASDVKEKGMRRYVVSSVEEFWFYYKQMSADRRHFYEVIPDDCTCHLYFDLEYHKAFNANKQPCQLIAIWIRFVNDYLHKALGIACTRRHVVELDSSTTSKFSQHLIWHLPEAVFHNNIHVGYFVKQLCVELSNHLLSNTSSSWIKQLSYIKDLEELLIVKGTGDQQQQGLFVDEGVYTRNRNFRLYKSSKLNKNIELVLSKWSKFDFKPVMTMHTCCKFHSCCNSGRSDELQAVTHDKLLFVASLCTSLKQEEIVGIGAGWQIIKIENSFSNKKKRYHPQLTGATKVQLNNPQQVEGAVHKLICEYLSSNFPSARVRKITNSEDSKTMIFDIVGTRYCANIGREHRSNNIMLVASLQSRCFYQKCYDPDCRSIDFKSPPIPFTSWVNSLLDFEIDTDEDDVLLSAAYKFDS